MQGGVNPLNRGGAEATSISSMTFCEEFGVKGVEFGGREPAEWSISKVRNDVVTNVVLIARECRFSDGFANGW